MLADDADMYSAPRPGPRIAAALKLHLVARREWRSTLFGVKTPLAKRSTARRVKKHYEP
jgi:hypothetical protein